jgi:hypothetical protein
VIAQCFRSDFAVVAQQFQSDRKTIPKRSHSYCVAIAWRVQGDFNPTFHSHSQLTLKPHSPQTQGHLFSVAKNTVLGFKRDASLEQSIALVFKLDPAEMAVPPAMRESAVGKPVQGWFEPMNGISNKINTNNTNNTNTTTNTNTNTNTTNTNTTNTTEPPEVILHVCFHPNITLLGSSSAFIAGTSRGEIAKYNVDFAAPSTDAAIVYPIAPFVDKEYINAKNERGFILSAANFEKKGNKVCYYV